MANNNYNTVFIPTSEGSSLLFQCPTLTATNYASWAIKMKAIMDVQGTWEAIESPVRGAVDVKKSKMAKAFIFQALPDDVLLKVAKHEKAKDVWDAIKFLYLGSERVQKARIQKLKSEFETLRMKETETIDDIVGKINGLACELRSLGLSLDDSTLAKKLVDSLPKRFVHMVVLIEQLAYYPDIMPFDEAVERLKDYEERVKSLTAAARDNSEEGTR